MSTTGNNPIDEKTNAGHGAYLSNAEEAAANTAQNQREDLSPKSTSISGTRHAEENPMHYTGGGKKSGRYISTGPISLRKKGPLGVILILLLVGIGGPLALLPLGPIAFVENVTKDLNDQVAAMDTGFSHLARNKLPRADREQAIKGCGSVVTIRCKFATLGKGQLAKLKYAGIEVTPLKSSIIPGRVVPDSYTFRGETFSAQEWSNLLKGKEVKGFKKGSQMHAAAMRAQRIANNARYASVSDKTFMSRVYKRFGVSKKPPELKGNTAAERVNSLLNKAGTNNVGDLKFTPTDENGNPVELDENGRIKDSGIEPHYKLDNSPNGKVYTKSEFDKMSKSIDTVRNSKPPSTNRQLAMGALNVVGYWDLACTVTNTIKAASVAAKLGNMMQAIQYVSPVLSAVHKIKAGDATAEDAQIVGDFFNQTDARKVIPDISKGTITESGSDQNSASLTNIPNMENPNYGKSMLDSTLHSMSTNGGIAPQTQNRAQFSLGFGNNAMLGMIDGFANITSTITNVGSAGACNVVQSWWARGLGLVAGIAIFATPGAGARVIQAAATATIFAGTLYALNAVLASILNNDLVESADLEHDTVARGELAWTGVAGMQSSGAAARGMQPATAEQLSAYRQYQHEVNIAYDDIERSQVTNQFDIYDQFSFAGTLARNILTAATSSHLSLSGGISNILGILRSGATSILQPGVHAASFDTERFKKCDDEAYKALGIDADVQCNVRYFMSNKDLRHDPDEAAVWMEQYVSPETGLPDGYTPPDPAQSQKTVMNFITGTAEGFMDSFTPDLTKYKNNYGLFLEFCAYRVVPLGPTGRDGGDNDWTTGKKCMEDSTELSYFRYYTLIKSAQEAEDGQYK